MEYIFLLIVETSLSNLLTSELFFCGYLLSVELQVHVKASDVYAKDTEAPPSGVDDMTKLAYLHEPGVLQNLRSRYDMNEIYVSCPVFKLSPFPGLVLEESNRWC